MRGNRAAIDRGNALLTGEPLSGTPITSDQRGQGFPRALGQTVDIGAFEATPMATVREVFETNTFGTMAMCQAVIPQFRARGAGTLINVTSSAVPGRRSAFPTPTTLAIMRTPSASGNSSTTVATS